MSWDEIEDLTPAERFAQYVMLHELEGGEFDWERRKWKDKSS